MFTRTACVTGLFRATVSERTVVSSVSRATTRCTTLLGCATNNDSHTTSDFAKSAGLQRMTKIWECAFGTEKIL